jgi:hypothetical protein
MSTEHDETTPVPAAPSAAPAGEPPTTPIPRTPSGRTEEPTLVFDTFAAQPGRATPAPSGLSGPRDDDTAVTSLPATEPVRLDKPAGGPAAEPARTSAFASAGGPERSPAAPNPVPGIATGTATAEPPAPAPAPSPTAPVEREISTTLRVGTVVWGLVLAIIGAGVIAIAAGASVDFELAAIGLLALAGLALVVGSVVTAARRKR